ncbi:hypothetical protein [Anaeromyxobacter oryzae]|nr:hypothetical protein [Anaeromyxobacter oryzae]
MRALMAASLAAALLASAPAFAQAPPFEPTGEVRFLGWGSTGSGAAFDADRIIGPSVNLTRREDGSWAGDLVGQNLDLQVSPKKLTGPNVNVGYETKDGRTTIEGLFFGQRIRLELDKKRLHGKVGVCSLDLSRKNPQFFQGEMGCTPSGRNAFPQTSRASLQLIGEAGSDQPPMPQLALALIAILPG